MWVVPIFLIFVGVGTTHFGIFTIPYSGYPTHGHSNYKSWKNKVLIQALEIKTKSILKNIKISSSDNLISNNDKLIWKIKNKTLFNMLLSALKSTVKQIIKNRINKDNKNAAKLWTALKTEYKIHAADTRFELV